VREPFDGGVEALPEGLDSLVAELRRPVDLGPGVEHAVMAALRAAPLTVVPGAAPMVARKSQPAPTGRWRSAWRWVSEPRAVRVSPFGALIAAGLFFAALLGFKRDAAPRVAADDRPVQETGEFPAVTGEFAAAEQARAHVHTRDTVYVTRFMIAAPGARQVALVGDFNDWDHGATPLVKVASHGVWTVEVPLNPGRYSYAFLVDGQRWMADPAAPRAVGDDFGRPSSVVTVRGGEA
jgi:hypothetical protein